MSLLRADALHIPLADETVDLICTSPPYFALRDYEDDEGSVAGQIGSEEHPYQFLDALEAWTVECLRVMKPTASLFVNLGDKRSGSGGHNNSNLANNNSRSRATASRRDGPNRYRQSARVGEASDVMRTGLLGLPWRYALRCVDQLGMGLVAEIIWCLSGGAIVYVRMPTADRPIMVRDLCRHYNPRDVQLWNGTKWTRALGWNRSTDTGDGLELELRSGERIGCTPGHRWPTDRGLVRADELRIGDVIDTCRLPEPAVPHGPTMLPDDDIGWFAGMYLAEGSRDRAQLHFAGHLDEVERQHRLAAIAAAYDGRSSVYQTSERGAVCNVSGPVLFAIIDRYVSEGTAKTKRLTYHAWQRSDSFLAALVTGYLEGDGHYDAKNDRWRVAFTENDGLAADLRTLAARLGAKLSLRRALHRNQDGVFPGWRGEWRWISGEHHNRKDVGQVVAIRASRARHFWDIGVEDEPHLFALASGVLTHNSKRSAMPESVTRRVHGRHEHLFHLVKSPAFFAAGDEIREPHSDGAHMRRKDGQVPPKAATEIAKGIRGEGGRFGETTFNPLGRMPGSFWLVDDDTNEGPVWELSAEPFKAPDGYGEHFAAFPSEIPRRCILGWCPKKVCRECGSPHVQSTSGPRTTVVRGMRQPDQRRGAEVGTEAGRAEEPLLLQDVLQPSIGPESPNNDLPQAHERRNDSSEDVCARCGGRDFRPGVTLDPFVGTGTTVMAAQALGRTGIGLDLSAAYLRLAGWRADHEGQRSRIRTRTNLDGQKAML